MMVVMMMFVIFSEDARLYLYSHRAVQEDYIFSKDLPCSPILSLVRRQQKSHVSVCPSLHL